MTINYIDIALILVPLLIIFISSRRGILLSLVNMVRMFLGVPFAFYVSRTYHEMFYYNYVKATVIEKTAQKLTEEGTAGTLVSGIQEKLELLPDFLSGQFDFDLIRNYSAQKAAEYIELNYLRPVALTIVEIALFVAVLLVVLLVTGIITFLIKQRNKKKDAPLRKTDMVLGGVFGVLKAMLLVFTICTIAGMVLSVTPQEYISDNQLVKQISTSRIINLVNEFNPLMKG